jgi:hypothetical protein
MHLIFDVLLMCETIFLPLYDSQSNVIKQTFQKAAAMVFQVIDLCLNGTSRNRVGAVIMQLTCGRQ